MSSNASFVLRVPQTTWTASRASSRAPISPSTTASQRKTTFAPASAAATASSRARRAPLIRAAIVDVARKAAASRSATLAARSASYRKQACVSHRRAVADEHARFSRMRVFLARRRDGPRTASSSYAVVLLRSSGALSVAGAVRGASSRPARFVAARFGGDDRPRRAGTRSDWTPCFKVACASNARVAASKAMSASRAPTSSSPCAALDRRAASVAAALRSCMT
mmetsp:Transcript_6842/g.22163  ORF Transcript_6842/g.22163 Transcript_6842/m.22163 type:complete len:224 (+) Transcript_6842:219-890(+)